MPDDEDLNELNGDISKPDKEITPPGNKAFEPGAARPKETAPEFTTKEPVREEPAGEEAEGESTVTVQPVQFASFEDLDQMQGPQNQNLNILLDIKLQLTVELGRTELPIKKVLELTKGSIVTLNKAAGEPVELYANGKLVAYGEVVVIEDNFGLRITHITDPAKRLSSLGPGGE